MVKVANTSYIYCVNSVYLFNCPGRGVSIMYVYQQLIVFGSGSDVGDIALCGGNGEGSTHGRLLVRGLQLKWSTGYLVKVW